MVYPDFAIALKYVSRIIVCIVFVLCMLMAFLFIVLSKIHAKQDQPLARTDANSEIRNKLLRKKRGQNAQFAVPVQHNALPQIHAGLPPVKQN